MLERVKELVRKSKYRDVLEEKRRVFNTEGPKGLNTTL